MDHLESSSDWPISRPKQIFLVWLGFFLLYSFSRSYNFSYDGICYALDVEFGTWADLFHPNHLVYTPLNRLFLLIAQALGSPMRSIALMIRVNAFWGATANALLYGIFSGRYSRGLSLVGTLGFGTSAIFWQTAVDPGCYALAALAACIVLWLLVREENGNPGVTGLLHGAAALCHLMMALVGPSFIARYFMQGGELRPRMTRALRYAAAFLILVGVSYAALGMTFYKGSISAPFMNQTGTVSVNHWWDFRWYPNALSFWNTFAESWIGARASQQDWLYFFLQIAVGCATLGIAAAIVLRAKEKSGDVARIVALSLWVFTMSALQFCWATGSHRFRVLVFPAVVTLALEALREVRFQRVLVGFFAVLLVIVGIRNYCLVIRPYSNAGSNVSLSRSLWVTKNLNEKDFLLFGGDGSESITNVYLAYFAPAIPARSLKGILFSQTRVDASFLDQYYNRAIGNGGRFFVESALRNPARLSAVSGQADFDFDSFNKWILQYNVQSRLVSPDGFAVERLVRRR